MWFFQSFSIYLREYDFESKIFVFFSIFENLKFLSKSRRYVLNNGNFRSHNSHKLRTKWTINDRKNHVDSFRYFAISSYLVEGCGGRGKLCTHFLFQNSLKSSSKTTKVSAFELVSRRKLGVKENAFTSFPHFLSQNERTRVDDYVPNGDGIEEQDFPK